MPHKEETIRTLLQLAEQTTSQRFNDFEHTLSLVIRFTEHVKTTEEVFVTAIKNGCYGKYGSSYSLTPQLICSWVYSYLRDKKNSNRDLL